MDLFNYKQNLIIRMVSSGVLVAAIAVTATGCDRDGQIDINNANSIDGETVSFINEISDREVTEAVRRELAINPEVSTSNIEIETNGKIVTLSGTVDNLLAKERAEKMSESVRGVIAVINILEVRADGRSSAEIAADVETALKEDPATDEWSIQSQVDDKSIVSLTGTVDSWQEKQLAARVVKDVKGVRGLDNNILVEYGTQDASDEEIEESVEQALKWDARVDESDIDVRVEGKSVILAGTVNSVLEKSLALGDAYVRGVEFVDITNLEVNPQIPQNQDTEVTFTDSEIKEAVETAMLYNPRVNSFEINVNVENGVVTLSGILDNLKAKRTAARVAGDTLGVERVDNNITAVYSEANLSDLEIVDNVRKRLERDPYVDKREVEVSVEMGVATLEGVVDTYFEKWQAGDDAALAKGTTAVINNLEVSYQKNTYAPYLYDWDPVMYGYDYGIVRENDKAIAENIQQEFLWAPFVDEEDLKVSVDNGVATLNGTIESRYERNRAIEEAYEGGAMTVIDELEMKSSSSSSKL